MPELTHSSHSQLETFSHCPMAWWLQKVAKVDQSPAAWFSMGTAAHTMIEQYERRGRNGGREEYAEQTRAEYDQLIQADIDRSPVDPETGEPDLSGWLRGGRKRPQSDIDDRREECVRQVLWYMDFADASEYQIWTLPDDSPALEVPFEITLGGVIVRGYIDAVWEWPDGSIEPVDLKTGTKTKSARQLGLYKVALEELYGAEVTHGRYLMLKKGEAEPIDLTGYTREYWAGQYAAQARAVAAQAFLPNLDKSGGCFTCTVKSSCNAYQLG